jgi:succinate dehydrogenase hydrophobic anchor subunit
LEERCGGVRRYTGVVVFVMTMAFVYVPVLRQKARGVERDFDFIHGWWVKSFILLTTDIM